MVGLVNSLRKIRRLGYAVYGRQKPNSPTDSRDYKHRTYGGDRTNEIPRRQEPYSNTFGADPQRYGGACFVSLFCGSCAVESKVTGYDRIVLNDKHKYLIALLRGVQAGYELPETITEEQYQTIKANKDADPVLTGFVGFGCSCGGKWFRGYARNRGGTN